MTTTAINQKDVKFTTNFRKGFRGSEARTNIDFKGGKRVKILTMKRFDGYYHTTAQFVNVVSEGIYETETFVVFQDFNGHLGMHNHIKRGTEKIIVEAHNSSIEKYLPRILELLEKQYGTLELI